MNQHLLPPERDFPASRQALRREHIMAEITRSRRRPARLARWIAGLTGALVLAGGGYAVAKNETRGIDVACYDSKGGISVTRAVDDSPIETCAELWREGAMKEGVHEAPPLVSCETETGLVGVYPGGPGTCQRLGLVTIEEPTGEDRERAVAQRKMVDDLLKRLNEECVDAEEAARIARELFAKYELTDWKVETTFESGDCALLHGPVDEKGRTVVVG